MHESGNQSVRILILDDHQLFRESVERLLNLEPEFKVVATCGSIDQALTFVRHEPVDLVLLDLDLGHGDGGQFVALAKRQGYAGKVLVVTAGVDKRKAGDLIRGGVSGIFTKNNSAASLAEGIRDVIAGKVWFDPEILQEAVNEARTGPSDHAGRFTERERLVLNAVFEGLANKEIAERLSVSEGAIKATLQQLFSKTGVRTRSQLVRVALELLKDEGEIATPLPAQASAGSAFTSRRRSSTSDG